MRPTHWSAFFFALGYFGGGYFLNNIAKNPHTTILIFMICFFIYCVAISFFNRRKP